MSNGSIFSVSQQPGSIILMTRYAGRLSLTKTLGVGVFLKTRYSGVVSRSEAHK